MSERGTSFLESLVDSGDIPVNGNDWLFKNNHTLICRIVKFDSKKNYRKFSEKTDKNGNVMPENTVEALRIWVQPFEHRFMSEGEPKVLKLKDIVTLNIKTGALAPIAALHADLKAETGNSDEICNWKISITRDDQTGKSGHNFTSFIVKKLERIGSEKDNLEDLQSPQEEFEETESVVDTFKRRVKSLEDVVPAFRDLAKSDADKAALRDIVQESVYKFGAREIMESKTPMKQYELVAGKFTKMTSTVERLKAVATAAQKSLDDEDIPF